MLHLESNFVFAPVKLGYCKGDGLINKKHLDFYEARSKNIGAVTCEPLYIDKGLRELPTQLGIDNDDKIAGLKQLNDVIHKNGSKAIAHLNHPGRMANPKIPGNYYLSSVDVPCENGGAQPKVMDRKDMENVISLFVDAALRAEKAGFDIIELQFGHGYLLAQFISPAVNNRDDEYGGSYFNRIKFPLEVFEAVKEAVKLPVIGRISGDEMIENGFHLPDMANFSKILENKGISAIHVTAGTVCSTPPWFFQHMFIPKGKTWDMAAEIKKQLNIPVIFVGRVNSKDDVEKLRNEYNADYIALGRALVADPDFTGKYFGKIKGNIRPCLACVEGCLRGVKSGKGLQCLVNPNVGLEGEKEKPADSVKKIAVVGGGLAGMQAAITLSDRGHNIDLFEKDKLGGQFNLAPLTPHKKSMNELVPYFTGEIEDKNINVIFKEATKEDIISKYDEVVLATGSIPSIPPIQGLKKFYWAEILLEENLPENKNVLIIGGGLIGVDIATALIQKNNKVYIVKRTTVFGEDMEMIAKNLSLKIMKEKGVVFSDKTHIKKIEGNTVYAEKEGRKAVFKNIDIIVVSTSMESYNPLQNELKDLLPVHLAGDVEKVGDAQDAISDGYEIAKIL